MKTIYTITRGTARKIKEHDDRLRYELRRLEAKLRRYEAGIGDGGGVFPQVFPAYTLVEIAPATLGDGSGVVTVDGADLITTTAGNFGDTVDVINRYQARIPVDTVIHLALTKSGYELLTADCGTAPT